METIKFDRLQAFRNKHVKNPDMYVDAMFPLIQAVNIQYLSLYACDKMETAMSEASLLLARGLAKREWSPNSPNNTTMSKTSNIAVYKSTFTTDSRTKRNKKDAGTTKNEESEAEEDKAIAHRLVDYKSDAIDPDSSRYFVEEIGQEHISNVFEVTSLIDPILLQRVILFKDRSYTCTCRSLENAGLVCAHFFATMVKSQEFRYHIGLINRRWFMEGWQNYVHLESKIKLEPFVHASCHLKAQKNILPNVDFMNLYLEILPTQQHAIRPPVFEVVKSQRVGMINSVCKSTKFNAGNGNQESYDRILKGISRAQNYDSAYDSKGIHTKDGTYSDKEYVEIDESSDGLSDYLSDNMENTDGLHRIDLIESTKNLSDTNNRRVLYSEINKRKWSSDQDREKSIETLSLFGLWIVWA